MANVLIVDDALFMRKMLADLISKHGHPIVGEAANAKDAIKQYKRLKPDVVTLDLIMPEEDDINTQTAVKTIKAMNKHVKIIIVSAVGQDEVVEELLNIGADAFIIKPFKDVQVIDVIESFDKL